MDRKEFTHRTSVLRHEVGDEVFEQIQEEAREDLRVREAAERIRELRLAKKMSEAEALVAANRDLIDSVRREKLAARGLIVDLQELEEANEARRQERVREIHADLNGGETDEELLRIFQLTDEDGHLGRHSLESPLFKERTKMAFEAYVAAVGSFSAFVNYNQMFGVPSKNVGRADRLRGEAHNEVSREVAEDLDLDFGAARKMVAKMRDGVLPQSSESDTYSRSVLRVGERLAKRYGDDIAEAVEEQLKPVIKPEEQRGE